MNLENSVCIVTLLFEMFGKYSRLTMFRKQHLVIFISALEIGFSILL